MPRPRAARSLSLRDELTLGMREDRVVELEDAVGILVHPVVPTVACGAVAPATGDSALWCGLTVLHVQGDRGRARENEGQQEHPGGVARAWPGPAVRGRGHREVWARTARAIPLRPNGGSMLELICKRT